MRDTDNTHPIPHLERWLIVAITLLAFGLRVWQLADVPPGWRDDELIEAIVLAQKVLDGQWSFFFPDASGHEPLYHTLKAGMVGLFGYSVWGIRYLSAILGTLAVPLTYLLGRKLFGPTVGLVAAAALAVSFWGLMYSRTGIRHVTLTPIVLAAFYFFWRSLTSHRPPATRHALLTAVFLALGFYTYFAGRGVPLILLAFLVYVALFARPLLKEKWLDWLIMFTGAILLAMPLILTLQQQPEAEARVAEVAVPLIALREGDFGPLVEYTLVTLGMFHATGDDEWLYNIANRPLFGPLGAILFWLGVAIAAWYALRPVGRLLWTRRWPPPASRLELACAFMGMWWLAGIAPGFVSVPPASLGHTIVAQSAVFILLALPFSVIRGPYSVIRIPSRLTDYGIRITEYGSRITAYALIALALLLLLTIGWRDGRDYFAVWPERGMVRFLYRSDIQAAARYLNAHPEITDVALTGLLAGPWDWLALQIDGQTAVRPRWYDPARAIMLEPNLVLAGSPLPPEFLPGAYTPVVERPPIGAYRFYETAAELPPGERVCFANGLCVTTAVYDPIAQTLTVWWRVERPLALPEMPIISNPPPPGVYAGPRLSVFAQLLDEGGGWLAGDDGLWVEPRHLQPGDRFAQFHRLTPPEGSNPARVVFGLYDPMTGERILTENGLDYVEVR
jgi:4-amino-4-deoxy-L-arabinose transferase-like glycosyltransferase